MSNEAMRADNLAEAVAKIAGELDHAEGMAAPHPNYPGKESSRHREGLLLDAKKLLATLWQERESMREALEKIADEDNEDCAHCIAREALATSAPAELKVAYLGDKIPKGAMPQHITPDGGVAYIPPTSAPAGDLVELLGTWKTEIKARMDFKEMQRSFHKGIYTEGAARADESDRALIERIDAAIAAIPAPSVVWEEKWYGYAGHFIGGMSCAYHLCTRIPGYLISTVGHYIHRSNGDESPYPIGAGADALYETYIFNCEGEDENGGPIIPSFSEIDGERYATSIEAERGHYKWLDKYRAIAAGVINGGGKI